MPKLRNTDLISKYDEGRDKLVTVSIGYIVMDINILVRNFDKFNLEWE